MPKTLGDTLNAARPHPKAKPIKRRAKPYHVVLIKAAGAWYRTGFEFYSAAMAHDKITEFASDRHYMVLAVSTSRDADIKRAIAKLNAKA